MGQAPKKPTEKPTFKNLTFKEMLAQLRSELTVDIPFAGWVLGQLSQNAAYEAARAGKLGVPVFEVGGRKRVASSDVLRRLGLIEERAHFQNPVVPVPSRGRRGPLPGARPAVRPKPQPRPHRVAAQPNADQQV
jgi:hypothetical protein